MKVARHRCHPNEPNHSYTVVVLASVGAYSSSKAVRECGERATLRRGIILDELAHQVCEWSPELHLESSSETPCARDLSLKISEVGARTPRTTNPGLITEITFTGTAVDVAECAKIV